MARSEVESGRRVVLTGTTDDHAAACAIARSAGLGPDHVLAGRTDLRELLALVAHAGRVVVGDTSVAHLATAFATPSVVLFGPTAPARWGPLARGPHVALWKGTTGDPHAATIDPGLERITATEVIDALGRLPTAGPRMTARCQVGDWHQDRLGTAGEQPTPSRSGTTKNSMDDG